jgi:Kinesin motor domain
MKWLNPDRMVDVAVAASPPSCACVHRHMQALALLWMVLKAVWSFVCHVIPPPGAIRRTQQPCWCRVSAQSCQGSEDLPPCPCLPNSAINNSREKYSFAFDGVLTVEAQQDEVRRRHKQKLVRTCMCTHHDSLSLATPTPCEQVFERVARPLVLNAMQGYNATVFAYGQTGSGKTFTITGGAERYVDRGIIPRAISALFAEVSKGNERTYTVRAVEHAAICGFWCPSRSLTGNHTRAELSGQKEVVTCLPMARACRYTFRTWKSIMRSGTTC